MLALIRKHGVAIARDSADAAFPGPNAQKPGLTALPNATIADEDAPHERPITVPLLPGDLADFGRGNSFAVTYFGPRSLAADKAVNEDFALAGVIEGRDEKLSFGVVADGVTTKTFWPARSSRIAAFAGYEVVKRFARDGWVPKQGTADEVGPLLAALCETVNRRFDEDRKRLREAGAVPTRWDAKLFEQHSEKTGFWYQTTLLLVVIGRAGGWLLFCGDGGVVRYFADGKRFVDAKVALESGASLELATSVGIGVSAQQFKRAFIRPAPAGNSLHVVLASDGVDRTLQCTQPEAGSNRYATLDLRSRAAAETAIQALAELPDAERDNMSVAHVCFPPDSAWPTEKVVPIIAHRAETDDVTAPPIAPVVPEPITPQLEPLPKAAAPQPAPIGSSTWLVITIAVVALIVGASAGVLVAATSPGSRLVSFVRAPFAAARPSEATVGRDRDASPAVVDIPGLASAAQPGPAKREAAASSRKSSEPPASQSTPPATPNTSPDAPPSAPASGPSTASPNDAARAANQPAAAPQSEVTAPAASVPAAPSRVQPAPASATDERSDPAPTVPPKGEPGQSASPPGPDPARIAPGQSSTGPSGG